MENYFVGRYRGPFGAGFFLLLCFGVKVMLVFYLGPVEGIFHLCRHLDFTCSMVPLPLPSCSIISLYPQVPFSFPFVFSLISFFMMVLFSFIQSVIF